MSLTGKAKLAGVAGWPIGHSLSPRLHGYWIAEHKLDAAYVPLAIKPDDFSEALRVLPKLGFSGINVTIPHKEDAFRLVDEQDASAKATGAVNTIVFQNGRSIGRNTDVDGFAGMLGDAGVKDLTGKAVVVLGAGGAARAVVSALIGLKAKSVVLANRSPAKSQALAQFFHAQSTRIDTVPFDEVEGKFPDADVLVNTTSLGMTGQPALDVDVESLPARAVVADIVYRPLETKLLADARARGLKGVDGLGMLLHQAAPGFQAWFGVKPQVTPQLRAHLLAALQG